MHLQIHQFIAPRNETHFPALPTQSASSCVWGSCVLHPYSPWYATEFPVSVGVCKSPKNLQSYKGQKVWHSHGRISGLAQTHPRLTNSTKAIISVTNQSKTQQTLQQEANWNTSPTPHPEPKWSNLFFETRLRSRT